MSVFQRDDWISGFPFSPSRLAAGGGNPSRTRMLGMVAGARINDGHILDGYAQNLAATSGRKTIPPGLNAAPRPGTDTLARRSLPARQQAPRQVIRLLPLEAFIWGSNAVPPQPRTRTDHALIWVTQGRLQLDLPRSRRKLGEGDLRWIPAGTAFAARPLEGTQGHVLLVAPTLTRDLDPGPPRSHFAATVGDDSGHLLVLMRNLEMLARQDAKPPLFARHLGLLALALGELAPERPEAAPELSEAADMSLLARFEALIRTELPATVTVADLAQKLGCSTAALDRACLARRGQRAIEAMNDMRLERAVTLLRETRLTPVQIAARLGYSGHAHFARAFAAATGRRPEIFRAQGG